MHTVVNSPRMWIRDSYSSGARKSQLVYKNFDFRLTLDHPMLHLVSNRRLFSLYEDFNHLAVLQPYLCNGATTLCKTFVIPA